MNESNACCTFEISKTRQERGSQETGIIGKRLLKQLEIEAKPSFNTIAS